jgi:hypothetical protein
VHRRVGEKIREMEELWYLDHNMAEITKFTVSSRERALESATASNVIKGLARYVRLGATNSACRQHRSRRQAGVDTV